MVETYAEKIDALFRRLARRHSTALCVRHIMDTHTARIRMDFKPHVAAEIVHARRSHLMVVMVHALIGVLSEGYDILRAAPPDIDSPRRRRHARTA